MKILGFLLGIYILFQVFLTGYLINFFAQKFSKNNLSLKMDFGIFFLPLFFFYGKKVSFQLKREFGRDEVELGILKISFFVNPLSLLLGKIQILLLKIENLDGKITSWIPSQEKIAWLPSPGKIKILKGSLQKGNLIFLEQSKLPNSKIHMKEITFINANLDLAYPTQIFFFSQYGHLKIGNGTIKTELCLPEQGFLKISEVKWSDLVNIGGVSIQGLGGEINLHANYKNLGATTILRGVFGKKAQLNNDTKNQRFAFKLSIEWEKFRLPLDLGIYNLIYMIFKNTIMSGVLQVTVIPILDLLEKIIKNDKKNN